MKGLELSRLYWEQVGKRALFDACPGIEEWAAFGLAGEGSDCFGYDDELSRDHDWGPGFCVWLDDEGMERFGAAAAQVYASLDKEFMGFRRMNETEQTAGRMGVHRIGDFLLRYLGTDRVPSSIYEWRRVPETGLSVVTNGRIFLDKRGKFTAVREELSRFYPEALRLKKLASHCALAAQSGQYNYLRCYRRGEGVAALLAMSEFAEHIQAAVFLINRAYKPYYKWATRRMRELPVLGAEIASALEGLTVGSGNKAEKIERISAMLIDELIREGLSDSNSDFLLHHAESIQSGIENPEIRSLHIMEG